MIFFFCLKGNSKFNSKLNISANYFQLSQQHPQARNILQIGPNWLEIKLITVSTKNSPRERRKFLATFEFRIALGALSKSKTKNYSKVMLLLLETLAVRILEGAR